MRTVADCIQRKLGLKVNMTKTHITRPQKLKYLGFGFYKDSNAKEWKCRPHGPRFSCVFCAFFPVIGRKEGEHDKGNKHDWIEDQRMQKDTEYDSELPADGRSRGVSLGGGCNTDTF